MTSEMERKQAEMDHLFEEFYEGSDRTEEEIADDIRVLRTGDDIDILLVYREGKFEFHSARWTDSSYSPDGRGILINEYYTDPDGNIMVYDCILTGYISPEVAGQCELGAMFTYGKPEMYDISQDAELMNMFFDEDTVTIDIIREHIAQNRVKPYTGNYMSDVEWDD